MSSPEERAEENLRHAIADAQEIVRAYDLKAEILGAVLALLAIASATGLPSAEHGLPRTLRVLAGALFLIAALVLLALLYPPSHLYKQINCGDYTPSGTYFLTDFRSPRATVSEVARRALSTNWSSELAFELLKVSAVRERKSWLFKNAVRICFLGVLFYGVSVSWLIFSGTPK